MSWVGRTIGGYKIESEIAHGGMAIVYRAFQPQLERWVAVKVLTSGEDGNEAFLARFRREAKAIAALRHPNILTVYDYGEEEGMAYIVMEYIAGGTLKELLTGEPKEWASVAPLILPVARALAYAHSRGIIHCDVKPANVLLPRPDWPLLADFGLFKLRSGLSPAKDAGLVSGTPAYISPEQVTGGEIGQRSDIFSLGVILYELVTGQLPFAADSPGEMMMQRLSESPLPPTKLNDHIPAGLEKIILCALAREARDRFPSVDVMLRELLALNAAPEAAEQAKPTPAEVADISTMTLRDHPAVHGPHLIVTGTETMLPLPLQKEVVLGRDDRLAVKSPDIDLGPQGGSEAGVSRHHARLWHTAKGWFLEDLNSTNGTSLNIAPLKPGERYQLRSGDVIRCGRLMLVFYEA